MKNGNSNVNGIRITGLEISDVKNVGNGKIKFAADKTNGADIIGVYGQNGSGKTALVNAMELLQETLDGNAIPEFMADYVSVVTGIAKIDLQFIATYNNKDYDAEYIVSYAVQDGKPYVAREELKLGCKADNQNKVTVYDCDLTDENRVLLPARRQTALVKGDKTAYSKLLAQKIVARKTGESLLFSADFFKLLEAQGEDKTYLGILKLMQKFARLDLFVIKNSGDGVMNIGGLMPVSFRFESENGEGRNILKGNAPVVLDRACDIPVNFYGVITKVISQLNVVLAKLVPNLQIDVECHGEHLNDKGEKMMRCEYVSLKDGNRIPLRCESEGIRKIISMIGALMNFYNQKYIVVVVDEFDAGIFEYLLGELVQVLKEGGRGQLLFTSHNLRPLEKLSKDDIYFTTCNKQNRYIKLTNVKPNNNLRDFYYRAVQIGGQSETVYEETNLEALSVAFIKAGEYGKQQERKL